MPVLTSPTLQPNLWLWKMMMNQLNSSKIADRLAVCDISTAFLYDVDEKCIL
jgi:hypothetical protein